MDEQAGLPPRAPPVVPVTVGYAASSAGRPAWATAISVISIVMGSLTILYAAYLPIMILTMRMQKTLMTSGAFSGTDSAPAPVPQQMAAWFNYPGWLEVVMGAAGAINLLLGVAVLVGGIQLLRCKPSSRGLHPAYGYTCIAATVLFAALMASSRSLMAAGMVIYGGLCGLPYPIVALAFMYGQRRREWFRSLGGR